MKRWVALIAVLSAGALSCGDTSTSPAGQLNLDRPVGMAFACYGGLRINNGATPKPDDQIVITAQPAEACNIRSQPHDPGTPEPVPIGQEDLTGMGGAPIPGAAWYGFILQSATGTVAIAEFETKPVSAFAGGDVLMRDADPLTPGKNGISVGEDPIAITPDEVGCYQVIANAGSCDLSALDITSALDTSADVRVSRITVKNSLGQVVKARPAAMVGEPAGGTIGAACSSTPTGLVYLAYPNCHAVAAVDTTTGMIVSHIDYSTGTPQMRAGDLTCADECDGGGGTVTAGIRPVTLDLELDARTQQRKLVIGSENSSSITIVELGPDTLPVSLRQVALEDPTGTLGVTSIALSPTIGMGGTMGTINDDIAAGGDFQFAYAISTDDTVRVADVLAVNRECDTQVDPRLINNETSIAALSCLKVGDPATPRRRPGARGPGIELTEEAIPISVEIFRSEEIPADVRVQTPPKLVGYFGIITASDGRTFVLNVDDDDALDIETPGLPLKVSLPLAIAHQLRDAIDDRELTNVVVQENMPPKTFCDTNGPDPDAQSGNLGGPRSAGTPSRTVPAGVIAAEKVGALPTLRQLLCTGEDKTRVISELGFTAPDAIRDLAYPDLRTLRDENWTLTWEGSLSLDRGNVAIDGPPIRVGQMQVDTTGFRVTDKSNAFCDAGVEQFDVLQLRGCDPSIGDAECPLGYTCFVHPNSQVAGIGACMLVDEADRLADACKDFLTSIRRYTVNRTKSGELTLLPRKHMLNATPVDGCVDDNQCEALADYAARNASSAMPQDAMQTDPRTYKCMVDTDRAPIGGTGKRCIETCQQTSDCATGRICQANICMDSVIPPQSCVNAPQRYELRAGEAFTMVGTRSGYIHSTILDTATGKCVKDPAASPFDIARVKLAPPPCDPNADPRTGLLPDGSYDANPCSLTVDHTETIPVYIPNSCTLSDPPTMITTRQAPAIRVHTRGPTFTMVDPYQSGDQRCIRDRLGTLGKIPLVFPGFQITWRQTGGFVPLTLPIAPSFPVKVVRGPLQ
nr:hypothetical protein [Deltaproteobacteria bacterium]